MTWIIQHKRQVRIGVFALLLIAILGPWGYEYDDVPLAENSSKPVMLVRVCVGAGLTTREIGAFKRRSAECGAERSHQRNLRRTRILNQLQ